MNPDTLDLKINSIMKQLTNHWNKEKYNYHYTTHKEAYSKYIKYYTGNNPYNVLEKKYQDRLNEIDINL